MQEKILEFYVDEQFIRTPHRVVVADSRHYLRAKFTFGEAWQGLTITAVFQGADGRAYHVLLSGDSCLVPPEVIAPTQFFVSVFGGDRLTTDRAAVEVAASGLVPGIVPPPTTPDIYTQLVATVDVQRQLAEAAADNAETAAVTAGEKAAAAAADRQNADADAVTAAVAADDAEAKARAAAFFADQSEQNATAAATAAQNAADSATAAGEDAAAALQSAVTAEQQAVAAAEAAESANRDYELWADITLAEDTQSIELTQTQDGKPLNIKKAVVWFAGHITPEMTVPLFLSFNDGSIYQCYAYVKETGTALKGFFCSAEKISPSIFTGRSADKLVDCVQNGNTIWCQGSGPQRTGLFSNVSVRLPENATAGQAKKLAFGVHSSSKGTMLQGSRIVIYGIMDN